MDEILKCSDCYRPLMNIRISGHTDHTTFIQATCPFCLGISFIKEINADFSFGPIGKDEPYNSTYIEDIEMDGNKVKFIVGKHK